TPTTPGFNISSITSRPWAWRDSSWPTVQCPRRPAAKATFARHFKIDPQSSTSSKHMSVELTTLAERNAQKAEQRAAFGGLNLLHIKRQVASLLGLIGRDAIFDQYTKHDITHIDEMLRNLDWIIPDATKPVLSDADWLMIVLAVYFHDMGMLVTKAEFQARAASGFPAFCEQVLFAGSNGPDYKAKVDQLSRDDKDRFLYQEFVRHTHGERIRAWILGQAKDQLGLAQTAVSEVSKLLEPVGLL